MKMELKAIAVRIVALAATYTCFLAGSVGATGPVDTCPSASWKKLPIFQLLGGPWAYAELKKLFKDLGGQYLPYVQNRATPAIGANAAFLALAVVFLLTFILWRMMRYCCFMICCKASCDVKRSKRDADGILFNRRTKVLKGLMVVVGLTSIALCLYGLGTINPGLSDAMWQPLDRMKAYFQSVLDSLYASNGVLSNTDTLLGQLTALKAQLEAYQAGSGAQVDNAKSSISGIRSTVPVDTLRSGVIGSLTDLKNKYKPTTDMADGYRFQATVALYCVNIAFVVTLVLFAFFNGHFGLNFTTFWTLILILLYFIIGVICAVVLLLEYDACPSMEYLIIDNLSSGGSEVALRYFLLGEGASNTKEVLKTMNIIDVNAQKTAFTDALTTLKNNIITAYNNDAGIRASVDGLYASRDAVFTSIDNTLALVDYADIVDVYGGVKNAICCTLPETLGSAWTATTIAGLLSLLLVLFVFFLIGKIDALPRADCCGCTFHTYKRYHGSGSEWQDVKDKVRHRVAVLRNRNSSQDASAPPAQFMSSDGQQAAYYGQPYPNQPHAQPYGQQYAQPGLYAQPYAQQPYPGQVYEPKDA